MKTNIFAILNITPDSFSDGGNFDNDKDAENQANSILNSSIDVIDVGAVATNPYVEGEVSTKTELIRLSKVLPRIIILAKKYNKLVSTMTKYSHEKLFRKDKKYDLLIPIKYNFKKPVPSKGSCIFLHLTKDYKPTQGCIALKKKDFMIILKLINKKTKIKIS